LFRLALRTGEYRSQAIDRVDRVEPGLGGFRFEGIVSWHFFVVVVLGEFAEWILGLVSLVSIQCVL
jgi:hypothetical protein